MPCDEQKNPNSERNWGPLSERMKRGQPKSVNHVSRQDRTCRVVVLVSFDAQAYPLYLSTIANQSLPAAEKRSTAIHLMGCMASEGGDGANSFWRARDGRDSWHGMHASMNDLISERMPGQ